MKMERKGNDEQVITRKIKEELRVAREGGGRGAEDDHWRRDERTQRERNEKDDPEMI